MSSQLGTVAGLLLKAEWEKFLALREISEFSHSLGPFRTFANDCLRPKAGVQTSEFFGNRPPDHLMRDQGVETMAQANGVRATT